jgi:tRNA threonylcarbamoyladenosine biosynthesis protein TsaE
VSAAIELRSQNPQQTLLLGRALGETLHAGDVVAISGPLGAGKTQLVKGIAQGLGVASDEPVVSPTFVLVREYRGRTKLYHVDAYRLSGANELRALGLEEMQEEPGTVIVIEWADRVPEAIPPDAHRVHLEHVSPTTRRVRVAVVQQRRQRELARRLRECCQRRSRKR